MNSYPSELLMQLSPVMFVAGLNATTPPSGSQNSASGESEVDDEEQPTKKSADPFVLLAQRLREVLMAQRRISAWQPSAGQPAGQVKVFQTVLVDKSVQFPPRKITPPSTPQATPHSPLSPLTPSSPLYPDGLIAPIWIRKHTALVPSVFVLFVRMWEWDGSSGANETPRSPLEPPIDRDEKESREARETRQAAERQHDSALSREIAERKKITSERGIKLTVVLMASRAMLDDPTLDSRLTYIRRTSGLDARAALFVLSPVSQAELIEFVKSLQQALYEPAIEYYAAHSKRVRRKRNRHAHATSNYSYPSYSTSAIATGPPPPTPPQPLRPEGWTVRYEYKMACFAEFRGEEEVALKHYQDAYSTMLSMFGSSPTGGPTAGMLLIPRTKRWAEAKVLADCINVKVMKLYLSNAEHSLALSQLRTHISRFMDLSERSWGIGRDTFELWGWVARQYRVFAELLELGTHYNLTIPTHLPSPSPINQPTTQVQSPSQNLAQSQSTSNVDTYSTVGGLGGGLGLGLNPTTALHHPGYYYLVAAECTERRREKFLKALNEEETSGVMNQSPGYMNEKKVDHLSSIHELYSKAYEVFKKYSPVPPISPTASIIGSSQSLPQPGANGRFMLLIAHRIARTCYEAGKYDVAMRFLERIARTYRIEHFDSLLRPLLTTWCACARQMGDVETGVRVLVEGVVCGSSASIVGVDEGEEDIVEDLMAALASTVPSSSDPLTIETPVHLPIYDSSVTFWATSVYVKEPAAFQVHLRAPVTIANRVARLPIKGIRLLWGDEDSEVAVNIERRAETQGGSDPEEYVDLGELEYGSPSRQEAVEANLEFAPGHTVVLAGRLVGDSPGEMKIPTAVVTLSSGSWTIEIPFKLNVTREKGSLDHRWYVPVGKDKGKFLPIRRGNSSKIAVENRPHQLQISFSHSAPTYLDERYPITLTVTNVDERELDVLVDVLLQPGEDDSVNTIEFSSQTSTGLIKGVSFGVLHSGVSAVKTLYLHSTGLPGKRLIDFSIQSRHFPVSSPSRSTLPLSPAEVALPKSPGFQEAISPVVPLSSHETLQTLEIEALSPFVVTHDVTYRHKRAGKSITGLGGVASLDSFDHDWWDDRVGGEATVSTEIECAIEDDGESQIVIEGIKLKRRDGDWCKISSCSIIDEDFPLEFLPDDRYSAVADLSLAPPEEFFADGEDDIPSPGWYEISWRREFGSNQSSSTTTVLALPSVRPPTSNLSLTAMIQVPSVATLHKPVLMTLVLRNNHPTRTSCPFIIIEPQAQQQLAHVLSQSASQIERPGTPTPANASSTPATVSSGPDPFVIAGLRSGRGPILVPGAETSMAWTLYPMACGPCVPLPRVRVFDRRDTETGRSGGAMDASTMSPGGGSMTPNTAEEKREVEIKVIDSRWDVMTRNGTDVLDGVGAVKGKFTIVVYPA